MATRVDPAQYGDTPIFQALLEERRGRWPGIPMEELPPTYDPETASPGWKALLAAPPAMYRVQPIQDTPAARTRPYAAVDPDPEETAPMPLPQAAEG